MEAWHLLHLVQEICSHILILKDGRKIIDGTLDEIKRAFSGQTDDASLETAFFRATGGAPDTPNPPGAPSGQP